MLAMFADRDRKPYRDLLPWSGEFAGKYLTGASQVYQATNDPALRKSLEAFVERLLPLQDAGGYFGPFAKENRLTGQAPNIQGKPGPTWDAWGHYHMMIGLLAWHEAVGSPAALAAAARIGDLLCDTFLGDKKPRLVDTGSTEMNLAPAHALCLLYRTTGQERYLKLARQIVDEFAAVGPDGKPLAGDYDRLEAYWLFCYSEWYATHRVNSDLFGDLWTGYYAPLVGDGLDIPSLRYVFEDMVATRPLDRGEWGPFLTEIARIGRDDGHPLPPQLQKRLAAYQRAG